VTHDPRDPSKNGDPFDPWPTGPCPSLDSVGGNPGPIFAVCAPKFTKLSTQAQETLQFTTPFAIRRYLVSLYIYIFYFQHSCTKVTRTTLCWEEGKATTALTADLKKKKIWFAIKLRSCPTFDPFLCFGPPNATYQKNPRHYEKENNTRRKMHKELDITWLGLLKKKHKNDYTKADDKLWTNQVLFPIKLLSIRF